MPHRYTEENLKKRKNLQHDPRLLQSIERWWQTCMSTTKAGTDELPKAEFVELNCRMFKARPRTPPLPQPNPYPNVTLTPVGTHANIRRGRGA